MDWLQAFGLLIMRAILHFQKELNQFILYHIIVMVLQVRSLFTGEWYFKERRYPAWVPLVWEMNNQALLMYKHIPVYRMLVKNTPTRKCSYHFIIDIHVLKDAP